MMRTHVVEFSLRSPAPVQLMHDGVFNGARARIGAAPPRYPLDMLFSLVAALSAAASVVAHGGVTSYIIGGTTFSGWSVCASSCAAGVVGVADATLQPYNDASTQTSIERPYCAFPFPRTCRGH